MKNLPLFNILTGFLAMLCVWSTPYLLKIGDTLAITNSIAVLPLFLVYFYLLKRAFMPEYRLYQKFTVPLGAFFSACMLFGRQLSLSGSIHFKSVSSIGALLMGTVIFTALLNLLWNHLSCQTKKATAFPVPSFLTQLVNSRFFFPFCWLLLFLCWLPVWLATWPGNWVYDVDSMFLQFFNDNITTWQPPMHTFLLGKILTYFFTVTGGSYNAGIAVYTGIQLLFLSFLFAFFLQYIRSLGCQAYFLILVLIYYCCFPLISISAVCATKDVLFTAFFLAALILLHYILHAKTVRLRTFSLLLILLFLALSYRNNMMYALLLTIVICLFMKQIPHKKSILLSAVMAICVYLVYRGPIFSSLGITTADGREMLSVPLQQVARVYNRIGENAFTKDQLKLLHLIESQENWLTYTPKCADNIKDRLNGMEPIKDNKNACLNLWLQTGIRYPGLYLESFLENTMDAWYPDTILDGYRLKHPESDDVTSYFTIGVHTPGSQESKFPWLLIQLNKIGSQIAYHKIPGISLLFSVGAMFWMLLFCLAYCLYKKNYSALFLLIFIFSYYLSCIPGPMVLPRYYLILFYGSPFYFLVLRECNIIQKEYEVIQ